MESVERVRDRTTARVRIGIGVAGLIVALLMIGLTGSMRGFQPSVGDWIFLLVLIGVSVISVIGGVRTLRRT